MRSVIRLDQTATNAAAAIRQIITRERTDVVTADSPFANPRGRGSGDLACCATPFLSFAGWSRRSPNGPQSPDVRCAVHGVRSCSGTGPIRSVHRIDRPRRLSLLRRNFGRCGPRLTGATSTPRKDLAPIRQDSIKNTAACRSTSHRRVRSRPDRFSGKGSG